MNLADVILIADALDAAGVGDVGEGRDGADVDHQERQQETPEERLRGGARGVLGAEGLRVAPVGQVADEGRDVDALDAPAAQ